ncbi:histidinol dehydrogenase [Candidatus Pelagibacter sp.]|jgi:sulfopropanediol 3-dehydrogenase|nr:histidinol dehydrogenase [Candidatus Pelagibacter sp.]MDC0354131.1 histidinol dehydrogenase [Candidatus Pelagibacter sp.]
MAIQYLKKSPKTSSTDDTKTRGIVEGILKDIEQSKEEGCKELSKKFDKFEGDVVISKERIEEIKKTLDQKTKDDVQFAHERVKKFAEAQLKNYGQDFEVELSEGLFAGQRLIPVNTAGCYVPAGRYAHIASAVMSVTTAKVAGVKNILVCSSPKPGVGVHPTIVYTADLCGADVIMNLGGVQAIAAMTNGLFNNAPADIIVGPGNQFVAEAKRILFGKVGIDLFAGPTEIAIIADETADPEIVAVDLVGQAEHGYNSPAWLYTTSKELAEKVIKRVPELIAELPELPRTNADAAWRDYGEVVLCDTDEEMASISDEYAPEHLEVQTKNLEWFHKRLKNYGSLFIGEETTVAYGDKCSGTNHILPTKGAGRYTGGLFVGKFIKTLSFQRMTKESTELVGAAAARLSRYEGMEAHARTGDVRLKKYGYSN